MPLPILYYTIVTWESHAGDKLFHTVTIKD